MLDGSSEVHGLDRVFELEEELFDEIVGLKLEEEDVLDLLFQEIGEPAFVEFLDGGEAEKRVVVDLVDLVFGGFGEGGEDGDDVGVFGVDEELGVGVEVEGVLGDDVDLGLDAVVLEMRERSLTM